MPRKSAEALTTLSVVGGGFGNRPQPPSDLTEFQKELWANIVRSEHYAFFKSAAAQGLLRDLVRHAEAADILARQIDAVDPAWLAEPECLERYAKLLAMRERETKAAADKMVKLRLTNQSRWTSHGAASAAKHQSVDPKPWERGA